MNTRAKFHCHAVHKYDGQTAWEMSPVYHGDDEGHENFKFNEASPNGKFELTVCSSKYKGEHPEPGKEYYLDITEASKE